jgi:hypothetical protein
MTGFEAVEFIHKEIDADEVLWDAIEKRKTFIMKLTRSGVFSDLEAGQKVLSLYPHWVNCKGILYIFDDSIGIWLESIDIQHKIVFRFTDQLYINSRIETDLTRIWAEPYFWVDHARFYSISKDLNKPIYIFTDLAI